MPSIEKLKTKTTLTESDAQECSATSVVKILLRAGVLSRQARGVTHRCSAASVTWVTAGSEPPRWKEMEVSWLGMGAEGSLMT